MRKPRATTSIEEKVNVSDRFLTVRTSKPKELVESVETLD
jgi:hypothetical protein